MLSFVYLIVQGTILGFAIIVHAVTPSVHRDGSTPMPTPEYTIQATPTPMPTWSPAPEFDKY